MKKLLGSVLALAMVFGPTSASAELLKNFKLSGQLDLQTTANRNALDFATRQPELSNNGNATFNDRLNHAQTRTVVSLDWDLLDDVHARITLVKRSRTYGDTGAGSGAGVGNGNGQALITAAGIAASAIDSIYVNEANAKINKLMGAVDLTLGRQHYGEAGDLIIYFGPSDKALVGMPATAIDAVRADWAGEWLTVTGLAGKTTGGGVTFATQDTDVDVRGLNFKINPGVEGLGLKGYVYQRYTHSVGALGLTQNGGNAGSALVPGLNDNLFVYGLKAKYEAMGFMGAIELARNSGESRNLCGRNNNQGTDCNADGLSNSVDYVQDSFYKGYAIKVDASYNGNVEGVLAYMPWVNFTVGSGRGDLASNTNEGFNAIASDFRPGTINGRFAAAGLASLGSRIPCQLGTPLCTTAIGGTATMGTMTGVNAEGGTGVAQVGMNNRVIWGVGAKLTPASVDQLTFGFSFWDIRFQRATNYVGIGYSGGEVINTNGMGVVGRNGIGNGNKHIGNELDFDLTWKHSDNVMLGAGVAGFKPGKYIHNIVEDMRANNAAEGADAANTHVGVNSTYLAYGDIRIKF